MENERIHTTVGALYLQGWRLPERIEISSWRMIGPILNCLHCKQFKSGPILFQLMALTGWGCSPFLYILSLTIHRKGGAASRSQSYNFMIHLVGVTPRGLPGHIQHYVHCDNRTTKKQNNTENHSSESIAKSSPVGLPTGYFPYHRPEV